MSQLVQEIGIAKEMGAFGAEWLPAVPMSEHTSLGVGGRADIVRVRDPRHFPELVEFLDERGIPWRFLGGGSNLLITDDDRSDVMIHLARGPSDVIFNGNRVEVSAAANLGTAVLQCAKKNLGGMEGLVGVPGTVGGALRMNAGAYGQQIGDVVRTLTLYRHSSGKIETIQPENGSFAYRHTSFAPDDIMLSVSLELVERPYSEILERIKQCNVKRRASQPINEKSAGCIFKNPPGGSTGKMIDELGLKGSRIGGAVISERHANFIVNRYHAKAADILKLIEMIRERILKAFGVELEEEVIIWKV
jgi:UDP-N-acetylmuramate dehydrogenase